MYMLLTEVVLEATKRDYPSRACRVLFAASTYRQRVAAIYEPCSKSKRDNSHCKYAESVPNATPRGKLNTSYFKVSEACHDRK